MRKGYLCSKNKYKNKMNKRYFSYSSSFNTLLYLNKKKSGNKRYFCNVSPQIPFEYVVGKNKPVNIFFHIFELDNPKEFVKRISNSLNRDLIYTVFIKVRYDENSFFMLGNQFGFHFKDENNIKDILSIINNILENYYQQYQLTDNCIEYIQLACRVLDVKLYNDYKITPKPNISDDDITVNNFNIPLSNNLGKAINVIIKDGFIIKIPVLIGGNIVNFLDVIKENSLFTDRRRVESIGSFDKDFKFYHLMDENKEYYILAIKYFNENNIYLIF